MNLFLMPLWFLSGALFPAQNAWGPIRWVMRANPLSYGLEGIRRAIYFDRRDRNGRNWLGTGVVIWPISAGVCDRDVFSGRAKRPPPMQQLGFAIMNT